MIRKIVKTIELKFWDVMIPVLSNSSWVRNIANKAVSITKNEDFVRQVAITGLIALAGFAVGFLSFTLSALVS